MGCEGMKMNHGIAPRRWCGQQRTAQTHNHSVIEYNAAAHSRTLLVTRHWPAAGSNMLQTASAG